LATNIELFENGRDALAAISQSAASAETMLIGVAYVTKTGLDGLLQNLNIAKKKHVSILCGIGDPMAHDPVALQELSALSKAHKHFNFAIVPDSGGIFHPKLYFFDNGRTCDIFIGSSNLTGRAFSQNTECVIRLSVSSSDPLPQACRKAFDSWTAKSKEPDGILSSYSGLAELQKKLAAIREEYKLAIKSASTPVFFRPQSPKNLHRDVVTALVNKGFICSTNFSITSLRVSIPSQLALPAAGSKTSTTRGLGEKSKTSPKAKAVDHRLVVTSKNSIHWQLLGAEEEKSIKKLTYTVGFGPQEYGFRTPWGFFVPERKFEDWLNWVKRTDEEIQLFMQKSIQSILRREATINRDFKQAFSDRFPKARKADVNAAAIIVKEHLSELRKVHKHELTFSPMWHPATLVPPDQMLNTLKDPALSRYMGTIAEEVFVNNLAEFARLSCERSRSATQGLKPGSARKSCENTLAKVQEWNFYQDKDLEKWCQELEKIIKLMPGPRSQWNDEKRKEHSTKVAQRIGKLNEGVSKMTSEIEGWRRLPANKVLEKFVGIRQQDAGDDLI